MDELKLHGNEAQEMFWKPISLTHVEYPKGDVIGYFLAWLCLLPIAIIVGFTTLILFRRDLHTLSFFCGLICNEIINYVLKHIFKESRPPHGHETTFTEYGMPSSHSQFMWFFASYMLMFVFIRIHRPSTTLDNAWRCGVTFLSLGLGVLVSYARVYLHYHTFQQVFWGAVVGILNSILWFAFVMMVLTPRFSTVAAWPISEFLMVRDSTLIPNVMWFEYTCSRSEARTRMRKLSTMKSQ